MNPTTTPPPSDSAPVATPRKIWLQWHGDAEPSDDPVSNEAVTWSTIKEFPADIPFVAEAELAAALARAEKAVKELTKLREHDEAQRLERTGIQGLVNDHEIINDSVFEGVEIMSAQLAAANERIAGMQADKARLDWLIANSAYIAHARDGDACWIMARLDEESDFETLPGTVNSTPRESIDAALRL